MNEPKYKNGEEYFKRVENDYPRVFEDLNEHEKFVLRAIIRGAYTDGRIDGIYAFAKATETRLENDNE